MCGPSAFPPPITQGTSWDIVGREANGAVQFNQLGQLHSHCLSMSHKYPLILAQFVNLINFPLACFKNPALVPANSK